MLMTGQSDRAREHAAHFQWAAGQPVCVPWGNADTGQRAVAADHYSRGYRAMTALTAGQLAAWPIGRDLRYLVTWLERWQRMADDRQLERGLMWARATCDPGPVDGLAWFAYGVAHGAQDALARVMDASYRREHDMALEGA